MAPTAKASSPHVTGILVKGAINIKNPVLIPTGGIIIFFAFVGFLVARTLIKITIKAAPKEPSKEATCRYDVTVAPPISCLLVINFTANLWYYEIDFTLY